MFCKSKFRQDFSIVQPMRVENKNNFWGTMPVGSIYMDSEIRTRKKNPKNWDSNFRGSVFLHQRRATSVSDFGEVKYSKKSVDEEDTLFTIKSSELQALRRRKSTPQSFIGAEGFKRFSTTEKFGDRKRKEEVQPSPEHIPICCELLQSGKDFTQNTSLHGLKYVGDEHLHIAERLFWGVTFIMGILAAAYFITILYKRWDDNPMIISLSPTATLLSSIPFPAVTICNMNGAKKSIVESIINNENNDTQAIFEKQMLKEICGDGMNVSGYPQEILDANWSKIQQFMVKVSQPCHEMVVSCKWRSESMSCNDLFNPELTDEGLCCSFNKVERGFIYRNPKQLQGLNYTFPYPGIDWSPEKGYPEDVPENANPWRAFGAGKSMGLTIVLDADLCDYYCSSTASVGFKMLLHNPIETPKISDFAYFLTPGLETRIEITPKISSSTPSLYGIPQAKRQCVFSTDRELRFYRTYTQRNCELECQSNFTLTHCKCVPFYLPKDDTTRICGTKDNDCVESAKEIMEHRITSFSQGKMNLSDAEIGFAGNCSCLPSCVQIRYGKQLTTSKLEDIFTIKADYLSGKDPAYYKRNMAVVHFFFRENSFTGFEKGEIFGFTDFLSSTGGLLGLFLGFSFMSAAEIAYFMSIRIYCSWHRKQSPKRNHENAGTEYPFLR